MVIVWDLQRNGTKQQDEWNGERNCISKERKMVVRKRRRRLNKKKGSVVKKQSGMEIKKWKKTERQRG